MRVRRISKDSDWTFGAGRANYARSSESVGQRVKTRLHSLVTDWFLNLEHGLPWFSRMERPLNLDAIERTVRKQVLMTPGVGEIIEYEHVFDNQTRRLEIHLTIKDIYAETQTLKVGLSSNAED
ncbi:hypothetical protein [Thorsellia anophelis]|uniref:Uncharacterized protein n=1 Tax=Thorsellia anophelis DSM 18579 TaxID=1123402 RepID=A0A1I0CDT2_9GAMM|nr:hypothetical protein [Thorsellia anophelis]SET17443.1 hypothetical protein SAMN02583745_01590 [Thorsellia anophelis DSM 18579]